MTDTAQSVAPAAGNASGEARRVRALLWTAWVTGFLVVVVGLRMLAGHPSNRAEVLLLPPDLIALREELHAAPKNEEVKNRIRALDLELRHRYFRHLDANAKGAWLLLGAGLVFVLALRSWAAARRPLPRPLPTDDRDPRRGARVARWAVAGSGAVVALSLALVAAASRSRLPASLAELEAGSAAAAASGPETTGPSPEDWLANWPMFRGPRGDGVAITTNAPMDWNGPEGRGVAWKTPVPAPGFSSPVLWGDRLFLTGGTRESRRVLCYDARSGALLWDQTMPPAPGPAKEVPEIPDYTGYAAPTPATDGRRVYASFGTGELAAFDFSGRLVWSKPLGVPENMYGHATSLVLWQDLLLVQFDQGDGEDGKSRFWALDVATGQPRWEQRRPVPASWCTPLVWEVAGRPQVLTLGEPWVIAYDAGSGAEIWRFDGLGPDLAPMPIVVGDLMVVTSPHNHVSGLRMNGTGDVTATHQAWQHDEYVPDITSPVTDGQRIYQVLTFGDLVCLDGATGETVWEQSLGGEFNASPTLVGNRIYLVSAEGQTVVVEAGPAYQELARLELGEPVRASPAVVDGRIYLRAEANLYCLGPGPTPAASP